MIPFPLEQFGGLNLVADPTEVGTSGAIDLLNTDLDRPGQLRARDGISLVGATALPDSVQPGAGYFTTGAGSEWIVIVDSGTGAGPVLTPVNLSTGVTGTTVTAGGLWVGANCGMARFGDSTHERLYVGVNGFHLYRWDGSAWGNVTPANLAVDANLIAVTPTSNRLMVGDALGTTGTSRVQFSDPGAPETYTSTSWQEFDPGDGQSLTALIAWRDLSFIFKTGKFFVHYGESTLSDGTPEFLYRAVRAGQGASLGAAVAGSNAVYFANPTGVYATTGGDPVYLSRALEPWIRAGTARGSLPAISLTNPVLDFWNNRLYVTDITNNVTLVYDTVTTNWMVWRIGAASVVEVPSSSTRNGIYFVDSSTKKLARIDPAVTTDNGSAISWSHTTGYSSAGGYFRQRIISSGERKKHFKTDILGSGTVTHQVLALNARPNDVADTGAAVTLGTAPAIARGSRRRGVRGTHFAHKLSGSGAAVVSGLTYWLSEISLDT